MCRALDFNCNLMLQIDGFENETIEMHYESSSCSFKYFGFWNPFLKDDWWLSI